MYSDDDIERSDEEAEVVQLCNNGNNVKEEEICQDNLAMAIYRVEKDLPVTEVRVRRYEHRVVQAKKKLE